MCLEHPAISNALRTGYPYDDESKTVFVCSGCGGYILDGQDYWDILGEQFCENCIDDARRTAEAVDETY